jgi:pSer/pThr/pTyr-binding forkhead associated (FHA) protein
VYKLTFEKGSLDGNTLDVTVPKITLGRERGCHVRLKDDGVSRHHCALEQRADGIYVCDLGATNGIIINGKRMREMEQRLAPGDLVRIGSAEFRAAIPAVAPAVTVALDAGKGARTEVLSLPPPDVSRRADVA